MFFQVVHYLSRIQLAVLAKKETEGKEEEEEEAKLRMMVSR